MDKSGRQTQLPQCSREQAAYSRNKILLLVRRKRGRVKATESREKAREHISTLEFTFVYYTLHSLCFRPLSNTRVINHILTMALVLSKLVEHRKLLISAITGVGGSACIYWLVAAMLTGRKHEYNSHCAHSLHSHRSDQDVVLSSKVLY